MSQFFRYPAPVTTPAGTASNGECKFVAEKATQPMPSKKEITPTADGQYAVVTTPTPNVLYRKKSRPSKKKGMHKDTTFSPTGTIPHMTLQPGADQIFHVTRTTAYPTFLTGDTSAETIESVTQALSSIQQYGDWTSLFDAYRFVKMEMWLIPRFTNSTSQSADPGRLYSITDFDGFSGSTTAEMLEFPGAIVSSGLDGHYRSCTPVAQVYASTGNCVWEESPWIDIGYPSIVHRGFAVGISVVSAFQYYDLIMRNTLEFKKVR